MFGAEAVRTREGGGGMVDVLIEFERARKGTVAGGGMDLASALALEEVEGADSEEELAPVEGGVVTEGTGVEKAEGDVDEPYIFYLD